MNHSISRSFLSPRAIQNARTRIFVAGSDPRFTSGTRVADLLRTSRPDAARKPAALSPRLFSPGLLDRLHAPLTRYVD